MVKEADDYKCACKPEWDSQNGMVHDKECPVWKYSPYNHFIVDWDEVRGVWIWWDDTFNRYLDKPTDDTLMAYNALREKEDQEAIEDAMEEMPDEAEIVGCNCDPEKKWICYTCGVERQRESDPWRVADFLQTQTSSSKLPALTKAEEDEWNSIVSHNWGSSYSTGSYQKCRHMEESVTFPDGTTVYATSWASPKEPSGIPDFGLYLDDSWRPRSIATMIPWKDYGLPTCPWYTAVGAIVEHFDKANEGFSVEVGCIGGHGRTGTVLACMAVLGGVPGKEAVEWVRDNYCWHAVESEKQEWFVLWFESVMTGRKLLVPPPWNTDPPPPPPPKPIVSTTKSLFSSSSKPASSTSVNSGKDDKGTTKGKLPTWLGNPFKKADK